MAKRQVRFKNKRARGGVSEPATPQTSRPGARSRAGMPGKSFKRTAEPHPLNVNPALKARRGGICL